MILVVFADTWQFLNHGYTSLLKDRLVAQTRALKDRRRAARTTSHNDKLACFYSQHGMCSEPDHCLEFRIWCVLNTDRSLVVIEEYLDDLGLDKDMEIRVLPVFKLGMNVSVSCVLSPSFRRNVSLPSLDSIVGVQVLQVFNFGVTNLCSCSDEFAFAVLAAEPAI